jgi:hypothetical protein
MPLVGNVWGYLLYWFAGDLIDLITYGPHVNTGMRQYFGGALDSPVLAVFVLVGTFLDLRLFMLVFIFILSVAPAKIGGSIFLRLMRIIDRLPFIP